MGKIYFCQVFGTASSIRHQVLPRRVFSTIFSRVHCFWNW